MFATLPLAVQSLRKILSKSRRSCQALPGQVRLDLEWAIFGSSLFFIDSHNLYHFFNPLHRLSSPTLPQTPFVPVAVFLPLMFNLNAIGYPG